MAASTILGVEAMEEYGDHQNDGEQGNVPANGGEPNSNSENAQSGNQGK